MYILISGSDGFIGGYVAKHLSRQHKVRAWLKSDVWERGAWPCRIDAVVHCGASSPPRTEAELFANNFRGMNNLIRQCPAHKFIFLSSVSLYGDVSTAVLDEHTPINNPDTYGRSKLFGELLLSSYAATMPSVALRLPGVIGPGGHARNWLPRVARQLINGEPVKAYNLTGPFNNAVHVADLAAFVDVLLESDWTGHEALVLGADGMTSVMGAINRLACGLGVAPKIERAGNPGTSPFTICSDRAIKRGYRPMDIGDMLDRYAGELRQECPAAAA